ncbi:MAG: histidine kinase dimerization/phosphoacceptor domain -containing protein [Nitrospirota bacterium]
MESIGQVLVRELDVVFFIYGLAFLIMGISILLQPKKDSDHKIAEIFWLLAFFGISHGANELLDMWAIIRGRNDLLDAVRWLCLVISYLFLFEFGRRFFRLNMANAPAWQKKTAEMFRWWSLPLITLLIFISALMSRDFWKVGSILARYALGLPGGLLIGFGFLFEFKYEKDILGPLKVKKYFISAGASFLIYGLLGGLVVPRADFFPSNVLNTETFIEVVGMPVQVLRAVCALAAAWSISGILKIFNWEMKDRLQKRTDRLQSVNEELELEIGERRQAQEQLNASLKEKDVLLKEIYHRTKNNMQVITSLLNLQSHQIDDPRYVALFDESRNRIVSMALVHEKLYRSKNLSSIDFKDYITSLVNGLLTFYGKSARNVSYTVNANGIILGIDSAIPCGLIINELISNSLKHAFPNEMSGHISIELKRTSAGSEESEYDLTVSDDGIGISKDIDIKSTKSLGLQLVTNLTMHQLRGSIELRRNGGTSFYIRFRELKYNDRL